MELILYPISNQQERFTPSIETHLAEVRGLPTKKFLPECINEDWFLYDNGLRHERAKLS